MNIEEIKTISLVDFLSHHSYKCTRSYRKRYWYLSPLHEEKEASFKVDLDCNMWYDFAEGKGGNIINLAQRLYPNLTPHEILRMLEQEAQNYSYSYIKDLSAVPQSDGNWQPKENSKTRSMVQRSVPSRDSAITTCLTTFRAEVLMSRSPRNTVSR